MISEIRALQSGSARKGNLLCCSTVTSGGDKKESSAAREIHCCPPVTGLGRDTLVTPLHCPCSSYGAFGLFAGTDWGILRESDSVFREGRGFHRARKTE